LPRPADRRVSLIAVFCRIIRCGGMQYPDPPEAANDAAGPLEHDPALCGQLPDEHARQNKGLERDATRDNDSIRSHPALEDDLATQATLWVVRLTSGDTTPEDRAAFEVWRTQSPAHAAALEDARRLWLALGPALAPRQQERPRVWRVAGIGALAASIAAAVLVAGQFFGAPHHDYVTAYGERRAVTLADGTQVQLSGGSALDVAFDHGLRKVKLAGGEAYFDVVHDAARPFTVVAGAGLVRDIGTAFSVRRVGDGAVVTVARGEVEIDRDAPGAAPVMLSPDQTATYGAAGPALARPTDSSRDLSWVRGRLILQDQSLAESLRTINRHYRGRLVLLSSAVGAERINAVIDLDRIDDWLTALDRAHAARIARIGSLVLVY